MKLSSIKPITPEEFFKKIRLRKVNEKEEELNEISEEERNKMVESRLSINRIHFKNTGYLKKY